MSLATKTDFLEEDQTVVIKKHNLWSQTEDWSKSLALSSDGYITLESYLTSQMPQFSDWQIDFFFQKNIYSKHPINGRYASAANMVFLHREIHLKYEAASRCCCWVLERVESNLVDVFQVDSCNLYILIKRFELLALLTYDTCCPESFPWKNLISKKHLCVLQGQEPCRFFSSLKPMLFPQHR